VLAGQYAAQCRTGRRSGAPSSATRRSRPAPRLASPSSSSWPAPLSAFPLAIILSVCSPLSPGPPFLAQPYQSPHCPACLSPEPGARLAARPGECESRKPKWRSLLNLSALLTLIVPPSGIGNRAGSSRRAVPALPFRAPFLVIAMNALMALPSCLAHSPLRCSRRWRSMTGCAPASASGASDASSSSTCRCCAARWPFGCHGLRPLARRSHRDHAVRSQNLVTLPALIYAQMGSYRIDAAAGSALILALFSMAIITLLDRGGARA